jgi:hypothetical protein
LNPWSHKISEEEKNESTWMNQHYHHASLMKSSIKLVVNYKAWGQISILTVQLRRLGQCSTNTAQWFSLDFVTISAGPNASLWPFLFKAHLFVWQLPLPQPA